MFDKLFKFFAGLLVLGLMTVSCRKAGQVREISPVETHSLITELKVFHDVRSLPVYSTNVISAQKSSYDTTGKNDDGFSGRYSFIKRNPDSTLLIFDVKGAGVINRIWTPTPNTDTLDFYIDGVRALSINFMDLFSGKKFPFVAPLCGNQVGGYYCYLPIPFSKSCRIISRGKKIQFHQIQYRLYPEGEKVIPFQENLNTEEKEALQKIADLWSKEDRVPADFMDGAQPSVEQASFKLTPGESHIIFEANQGGRIVGIEISPAEAFSGMMKDIDLRITWDNENIPAVLSPVSDFFGYAFGSPSMQSLLIGSKSEMNFCYFPMPYDEGCKIELMYRGSEEKESVPVQIESKTYYTTEARNKEREGKFYADWNPDLRPPKGKPHVFLEREGKGHYVGTILQAQGLKSGMTYFFEGDDSTSIDGVMRMHGTGSEDYFNGGWYALMDRWEGKLSLPLHGALDYSLLYCRTGGYRLFLSDKMSFEKSIHHSIEHGPIGNDFPVDYTSVALYYADTPPLHVTTPTDELTRVMVPDTLFIYPQLADFNINGNIGLSTTWKYGTGGESYIFTVDDNAGIRVSLRGIPDGKYRLQADLIKNSKGCDFSVWQRQTEKAGWLPSLNAVDQRAENIELCELNIGDFTNTITFRFKTTEKQNVFLLNRLVLIKK